MKWSQATLTCRLSQVLIQNCWTTILICIQTTAKSLPVRSTSRTPPGTRWLELSRESLTGDRRLSTVRAPGGLQSNSTGSWPKSSTKSLKERIIITKLCTLTVTLNIIKAVVTTSSFNSTLLLARPTMIRRQVTGKARSTSMIRWASKTTFLIHLCASGTVMRVIIGGRRRFSDRAVTNAITTKTWLTICALAILGVLSPLKMNVSTKCRKALLTLTIQTQRWQMVRSTMGRKYLPRCTSRTLTSRDFLRTTLAQNSVSGKGDSQGSSIGGR
jgi:hypothetical protein